MTTISHKLASAILSVVLMSACQSSISADRKTQGNEQASPITNASVSTAKLEQDLAYFSSLFEGEYSNFGKAFDGDALGSVRHYVYRKVTLPAFGEHVIYVQQYAGSGENPNSVYRQRLYHSYADPRRNEIVTRIYSFPKGQEKAVRDAQYDVSKLQKFTPAMMPVLPDGCEVFWSRDGDRIVGYQKEGVCVMNIPNTEKKMLLIDDLVLSPTSFTTQTFAKDLDGNKIFGEESPSEKHRATIYHCDLKQGQAESQKIRVHDLGGEFTVDDKTKLRLRREDITLNNSALILELLIDNVITESETSQASDASFKLNELNASCSAAKAPWQTL